MMKDVWKLQESSLLHVIKVVSFEISNPDSVGVKLAFGKRWLISFIIFYKYDTPKGWTYII